MQYTEKGLLEAVCLGRGIIEEHKDRPLDFKTSGALMVLLHLEQVLDGGRVLMDTGDSQVRSKQGHG
jgi:hypothetical protein